MSSYTKDQLDALPKKNLREEVEHLEQVIIKERMEMQELREEINSLKIDLEVADTNTQVSIQAAAWSAASSSLKKIEELEKEIEKLKEEKTALIQELDIEKAEMDEGCVWCYPCDEEEFTQFQHVKCEKCLTERD